MGKLLETSPRSFVIGHACDEMALHGVLSVGPLVHLDLVVQ